jgi:hypothetical protein
MDFQAGKHSYCTQRLAQNDCSFKLAAYRVQPVSFCSGEQLHVQVKLRGADVTFHASAS